MLPPVTDGPQNMKTTGWNARNRMNNPALINYQDVILSGVYAGAVIGTRLYRSRHRQRPWCLGTHKENAIRPALKGCPNFREIDTNSSEVGVPA